MVRLLVVCLVGGLAGCETSAPKKDQGTIAEVAAPVTPVTLDGAKLCQARAEVEDALALGAMDERRQGLLARKTESPDDAVAIYISLLAIDDEQARWKAFKGLSGRLQPVRDLGECEIYAAWKMNDQARGPCGRVDRSVALVAVAEAELARKKGDLDQALTSLDAALSVTPGCVPALRKRALIYEAKLDAGAADKAWAEALLAWPKCASCAVARARAAEKAQGKDAALPLWEAAMDLAPTNMTILKRYAAAQVGKNDSAALAAYEKALVQNSESFPTLMAAARLSRDMGDTVKAVQYAEKASSVEPDNIEIWRDLSGLYQTRKETTGFEKALGEILRILPEDGMAHHELARLAHQDTDYVGALEHYEQALPALAADEKLAERSTAARAELTTLKTDLLIAEPGPSGDANQVVEQVQRTARKIFTQRLKKRRGLKGVVKLKVRTDKQGDVVSVDVSDDTLKDPMVTASLVGNLRAAHFDGGAQRLQFELTFE